MQGRVPPLPPPPPPPLGIPGYTHIKNKDRSTKITEKSKSVVKSPTDSLTAVTDIPTNMYVTLPECVSVLINLSYILKVITSSDLFLTK